MKKIIKAGATDQTIDLFIQDSTSTTGGGKTGLAYNTASLVCYYRKGATGTPTALTLATQTVGGAHSDGGFVELDATNMPGMYRLDLSDTIVATAGSVSLMLKGATGMAPLPIELQVIAANLDDAVRLGLTALPNAAADAAGGLPISDAGGLDLDTKLANTNEVTAARMAALTDWIDGGRLDLILDARASQTSVDDLPTNAELATALAAADDAVLAAIAALNNLSEASIRNAIGMATANLDIQLDALPTAAENQSGMATAAALSTVAGYIDTEIAAIISAIAALNNLSQADVRTALGMATGNLDTQLGDLPTNAELAVALAAADDAVLAQIALVKAKSDLIPAAPAAVGDIPTAVQVAEAVLLRDWTAIVGAVPARSMLNALRAIRNKWSVAAGVMTVTKEDDLTTAWTSVLSTDAAADPIIASDPS